MERKKRNALLTVALTLAALAMISSIFWTGVTYTAAAVVESTIGYYGIVAIIIAFFTMAIFLHRNWN
jgi:uncharacterized membrane protein